MAHQVQSESILSAFDTAKNDGLEITKTWVTPPEGCPIQAHKLLDGQTVLGDELFHIDSGDFAGYQADGPGLFGEPELDDNCKCWLVAGIASKRTVKGHS